MRGILTEKQKGCKKGAQDTNDLSSSTKGS